MKKMFLITVAVMMSLLMLTACNRETEEERLVREALELEERLAREALEQIADAFSDLGIDPAPFVPGLTPTPQPLPTIPEAEVTPEPTPPPFVPISLPLTASEQTFHLCHGFGWAVTDDGDLVSLRIMQMLGNFSVNVENTIDTDVRSVYVTGNVGAGRTFFYIKNDNSLWGWGQNTNGRLGDGTGVNRTEPVHILDDVAWVGRGAAGEQFMYAITTTGVLFSWGGGQDFAPVQRAENVVRYLGVAFPPMNDASAITFSGHGLVLTNTGKAVFYESGDALSNIAMTYLTGSDPEFFVDADQNLVQREGQVQGGGFNVTVVHTETVLAEDVENFSITTAGGWGGATRSFHIIRSDNSLWGWGANADGQLGDGTRIPEREEPVLIADNVISVIGRAFLTSNGELWTWSSSDPTPQMVLENVVSIGTLPANASHSLYAVLSDGTINAGNAWEQVSDTGFSSPIILENIRIPQTRVYP